MERSLSTIQYDALVRDTLSEDLGRGGDITGMGLLDAKQRISASFVGRHEGVLAGLEVALHTFRLMDPSIEISIVKHDGAELKKGDEIARVRGSARSIVAAERTALNFLCQLSGVSTLTAKFAKTIAHTTAKIAATRKTVPGLRALQKYAVEVGGGLPHRFGLDDAVLIKDNHIAAVGSVKEAIRRARVAAGHMRVIEVEVDTLEQLKEVLGEGGVHAVLLDNMSPEMLRKAVALVDRRCITEASGGVTLATVKEIAESGVDVISTSAVTQSAPALDIGLDVVNEA